MERDGHLIFLLLYSFTLLQLNWGKQYREGAHIEEIEYVRKKKDLQIINYRIPRKNM